jgi:hypothetical protein
MLTLRRTGLSSPAYRDWLDYVIVEDGRDVGRLYEDRHSRPDLRWFWSITVYVNPMLGSKYPPAEPGALGLEPLEAAGPCCINPHSYSHCAMPPQEPSVLLGHPYLTFW